MNMSTLRRSEGFTATELITVVAVLGAVAYLLLPLIFSGETLSVDQKLEKDLNQLSEILEERERIALLNESLDKAQVGNLGVFSEYSEVTYQVEIDTSANEINYCIIGKIDSALAYIDSYLRTVGDSPVGFCIPEGEEAPVDEEASDEVNPELDGEQLVEDETTTEEETVPEEQN